MSKRLRDKEAWIVTAKREQAYEKEHPEYIEEKVAELKEIRKQKDMTRAEQAAFKAYPYVGGVKGLICESSKPIFIQGYEQAEKETIERACKWLFSHLPIIVDYYFDEGIHEPVDRSEFIKSFRTQMEEEQ